MAFLLTLFMMITVIALFIVGIKTLDFAINFIFNPSSIKKTVFRENRDASDITQVPF